MKERRPDPTEDALNRTLSEWKVTTPLPPRFQQAVWQGIERAASQTFDWRDVLAWLGSALSRPTLATSYIAVLLLAGVFGGYLEARAASAHAEAQLSARYVQVIDPYRAPAP